MNRRIIIRNSVPGDAASTREIRELAFASVHKIYKPRLSEGAEALRPTILGELVAVHQDVIVGTVRYADRERRLHLIGLAVHPEHRRCGIARALVKHLADLARDRGSEGLSLFTIEQTGNVALFEKLGFAVAHRHTPDDIESVTGEPLSEVLMMMSIEQAINQT